ncbi:MAG TPA: hypothetical protein VGJ07_25840 [Rugosimonospora sp.]|jgi:DnaJ-domain-containing protein 1
MTWVAYVDESMRQRRDGSGIYVLAAAMLDEAHVADVRETARTLGQGKRRFHWRDAMAADRRKAVAKVATLDALHLVAVGVGLDNPRQERARRQCIERLLWELDRCGVSTVWFEARKARQNADDLAAVAALRARRVLRSTMRVDFALPSVEPLVWLPDVVAGAVSSARGDGDEQFVRPLRSILTECEVTLR